MSKSQRGRGLTSETARHIPTRLLAEVFAGFEEGDQITVLDLGPGNADTLQFLARYRARVLFADLTADLTATDITQAPATELDHPQLTERLAAQLSLTGDVRFNVCLFWDYLHFLDLKTLDVLSDVLQGKLARGVKGYGFGTLQGREPSQSARYGIVDLHTLAMRAADPPGAYHAHSQQRLSAHFPAMPISRGTLLQEGHLELLFESV